MIARHNIVIIISLALKKNNSIIVLYNDNIIISFNVCDYLYTTLYF